MISGQGVPNYKSKEEDEDLQQLTINLDAYLSRGQNYTLRIDFTGPLTDDLLGFYYSSYKDGNKTM